MLWRAQATEGVVPILGCLSKLLRASSIRYGLADYRLGRVRCVAYGTPSKKAKTSINRTSRRRKCFKNGACA